jgi:hypothetical protein
MEERDNREEQTQMETATPSYREVLRSCDVFGCTETRVANEERRRKTRHSLTDAEAPLAEKPGQTTGDRYLCDRHYRTIMREGNQRLVTWDEDHDPDEDSDLTTVGGGSDHTDHPGGSKGGGNPRSTHWHNISRRRRNQVKGKTRTTPVTGTSSNPEEMESSAPTSRVHPTTTFGKRGSKTRREGTRDAKNADPTRE